MEEIFCSDSTSHTEKIAAALSLQLDGFIALRGEMGAGKTAFARGFVCARYPSVRVSSPSYSVINCYAEDLYHLDLYRLADEDDLESVGFFDIPSSATVLCEWAERLPTDVAVTATVFIEKTQEDKRIIRVVR